MSDGIQMLVHATRMTDESMPTVIALPLLVILLVTLAYMLFDRPGPRS